MAIGISSDRPVQAADPSQRDQPLAPNLQDSLACRDGQLYTAGGRRQQRRQPRQNRTAQHPVSTIPFHFHAAAHSEPKMVDQQRQKAACPSQHATNAPKRTSALSTPIPNATVAHITNISPESQRVRFSSLVAFFTLP